MSYLFTLKNCVYSAFILFFSLISYSIKAQDSTLIVSGKVTGENGIGFPKNLRILRYAEVLLMNAEASNELGLTSDALTSLNKVRARAKLPAVGSLSQTALRDTIWHERRVELAMEYDRFFDIVRQGRAGKLLRAQGKNFVDGKNELYPIPTDQIQLSGGRLTQNPGY
jgi:hypothetical protein